MVISILGVLTCLLVPSLAQARHIARKAVCKNNLRTVQIAYMLYLEDNGGNFFPFRQTLPDSSVLWYWGLEPAGAGPEGSRGIDATKARLARYFTKADKLKICPSIPYEQAYFKAKFNMAGYGYGLNQQMLLAGTTNNNISQVTRPAETIAWGDCAQVNFWQAPASPSNPMLEEWYVLTNSPDLPTFHFRHSRACNVSYADGTIGEVKAYWLDPRVDGLTGGPEGAVVGGASPLLEINKRS